MVQFKFLPTAIGSLPHKEVKQACALVMQTIPEIPCLPQFPRRSFYEGMVTQFSERLPGLEIDIANKKVWIESSRVTKELEPFYQNILNHNLDYFAITPDYAQGFYEMLKLITEKPKDGRIEIQFLKGQITGPITFGLNLTDETGKAVIYNEVFADVVVKCLLMKALWQVKRIKQVGLQPIVFIDEPSLMEYGSAYLPVNRTTVDKQLTEIIDGLHKEDVLVGIHCCGNTDWGMLLELPIDIISFDAYGFMDKFSLYPEELNRFIQRGGVVAWGLVPSGEIDSPLTVEEIVTRLQKGIEILTKKGIDKTRILSQSLLTPSCGLGALSESEAKKRFALLRDTSLSLAV